MKQLPTPLMALRILGLGALLAYPVVTSIAVDSLRTPSSPVWKWYWLALLGPAVAFLGFIGVGAGFRAAGSVLRGALAGAALYLLLGAAFNVYIALRFGPLPDLVGIVYVGVAWPLEVLQLLGWLGLRFG